MVTKRRLTKRHPFPHVQTAVFPNDHFPQLLHVILVAELVDIGGHLVDLLLTDPGEVLHHVGVHSQLLRCVHLPEQLGSLLHTVQDVAVLRVVLTDQAVLLPGNGLHQLPVTLPQFHPLDLLLLLLGYLLLLLHSLPVFHHDF